MEAVRRLLDLRHRGRPEDIPAVLSEAAPFLDAVELSVLLIDYNQHTLWPLTGTAAAPLQVNGTTAGRAFSSTWPAAEIIWNQLPPLTFAVDGTVVAAALEPCYDVGGDAFDYATNGHLLHIALFDTVGHGIAASGLTTLTLNTYRNARRSGLTLADTYKSIDKWIRSQQLEPGDALVLYTDGITEARNLDGELFGVERLTDFVLRDVVRRAPAAETMRRLIHTIEPYENGDLRDDATAAMLQWHPSRKRNPNPRTSLPSGAMTT
jgi:Stage II sporulation protein E (SpoIIE)